MRGLRNSRERESHERQTDEMDRRVADDDIMSESYKSITQKKSHKRCLIKYADVTSKNGMTKRRLGRSRATQVRMEYLRLLIYQKYVQVEGLDTSKLLVNALDG